MIVDDSAIMRNRIARLCAKPGLEGVTVVAMAGDGAQALERAAQAKPDLITMDLTMPVMDGPACLRALRDVLPQARVLVVPGAETVLTVGDIVIVVGTPEGVRGFAKMLGIGRG